MPERWGAFVRAQDFSFVILKTPAESLLPTRCEPAIVREGRMSHEDSSLPFDLLMVLSLRQQRPRCCCR